MPRDRPESHARARGRAVFPGLREHLFEKLCRAAYQRWAHPREQSLVARRLTLFGGIDLASEQLPTFNASVAPLELRREAPNAEYGRFARRQSVRMRPAMLQPDREDRAGDGAARPTQPAQPRGEALAEPKGVFHTEPLIVCKGRRQEKPCRKSVSAFSARFIVSPVSDQRTMSTHGGSPASTALADCSRVHAACGTFAGSPITFPRRGGPHAHRPLRRTARPRAPR
jgi:hypothetical protein